MKYLLILILLTIGCAKQNQTPVETVDTQEVTTQLASTTNLQWHYVGSFEGFDYFESNTFGGESYENPVKKCYYNTKTLITQCLNVR